MADMKKVLFLYRESDNSNEVEESMLEGEALVSRVEETVNVNKIHNNSDCIAS